MNRFTQHIQRILRKTQGNTIARLWCHIWKEIHNNELTDYQELFIQSSCEALQQEFISRYSELSTRIKDVNGYDHETDFEELRIVQDKIECKLRKRPRYTSTFTLFLLRGISK